MTQTFRAAEFFPRVIGKEWSDLDLCKILDELPECDRNGPWLAGGSIRRTISAMPLESDFDFFFASEEQLGKFSKGLERLNFVKKKETEHHVQYEGFEGAVERCITIQLIRFRYYGNASEVLESFDFTICQFVFDGEHIHCGDYALWDLGRKRLAVGTITFPVSSMRRLLKYARQGFTACDGCLAALATAISDNPALADNLNIHYVD